MTSDTYNILFIVFLIIGILFAVLAAALFFVFDIRKIISVKTGMAMRKSVKELSEINTKEDNRRRQRDRGHAVKPQILEATEELNQLKNETTVLENSEKEQITITPATVMLEHTPVELAAEAVRTITDDKKEFLEMFNITETKIMIYSSEIIGKL